MESEITVKSTLHPSSGECLRVSGHERRKARGKTSRPRLLLLLNDEKYFQVHRLDHARVARDAGMEVLVATRAETDGQWIKEEGFRYLRSPIVRGIRPPWRELAVVMELTRLYQREKPDIVHHFAMKPVLFGSWAARLAGVPAVMNTFAGLGCVFAANGWRSRILRVGLTAGLRSALSLNNSRVLFENIADRQRLIRAKVVQAEFASVVGGTGIDIERFKPIPERLGVPIVVLACRMLWDKGVGDFVRAGHLLRKRNIRARCVLVGTPDRDNPSSISESQLRAWQDEGVVEWWGYREDMPSILSSAHIVVLPTFYGEGLPRILLEACASGRPVVATDIPGCTEVVRDGENGTLVPPKDPEALAAAITRLLNDTGLRTRMGQRGREIVVDQFSVERVSAHVMALYRELLNPPPAS